jgi:transcriptional regulator with XRE-family HTH domain
MPNPRKQYTELVVARAAMRLTQAGLAELIDADQSQVSRWESGRHRPNVLTISKLSEALRVPYEALLPGARDGNELPVVQPEHDSLRSSEDEEVAA